VDIGLTQIDAEELVSQMMLGSAELMRKSGKTPTELRIAVTSKGGTTERALQVFNDSGLAGIVKDAVEAAYKRARELGS
jgi:pyrroline-5-carboxylate reductase